MLWQRTTLPEQDPAAMRWSFLLKAFSMRQRRKLIPALLTLTTGTDHWHGRAVPRQTPNSERQAPNASGTPGKVV
jgi:hypothetical protein